MTRERKLKISISLDADVLDAVDRRAAAEKTTRSAIMEQWLRHASRQTDLRRLEEETAAYYDALTPRERADDAEWADFASRSARKLVIDEPAENKPRRRSRRIGDDMQKRGHLYWAEMDKRRPVLVISTDSRNERANDVVVDSVLDGDAPGADARARGARRRGCSRKIPCSSASRSRR